jgi:DNA replication and repair protein RecF
MEVNRLFLSNVRCFVDVDVDFSLGINVVNGNNSSGKTTLIESIHVLSSGKSFRSAKIDNLRQVNKESMTISSNIYNNNINYQLGLYKTSKLLELRVDTISTPKLSDLANHLAVITYHAGSDQLIQGEPIFRRRFIDWCLFHTQIGFFEEWSRYQRILKQRNAILRSDVSQIDYWNQLLAQSGEIITNWRIQAVETLMSFLNSIIIDSNYFSNLSFSFISGWPISDTLISSLQRSHIRDAQQGFTSYGPHRADLRLRMMGKDAKDVLSRGQQKTLTLLMLLALASYFHKSKGQYPIFLLDDLAAELDIHQRIYLFNKLSSLGCQVILTSLNESDWNNCLPSSAKHFLVRKGTVSVI